MGVTGGLKERTGYEGPLQDALEITEKASSSQVWGEASGKTGTRADAVIVTQERLK